jgi:hypothetical protein
MPRQKVSLEKNKEFQPQIYTEKHGFLLIDFALSAKSAFIRG